MDKPVPPGVAPRYTEARRRQLREAYKSWLDKFPEEERKAEQNTRNLFRDEFTDKGILANLPAPLSDFFLESRAATKSDRHDQYRLWLTNIEEDLLYGSNGLARELAEGLQGSLIEDKTRDASRAWIHCEEIKSAAGVPFLVQALEQAFIEALGQRLFIEKLWKLEREWINLCRVRLVRANVLHHWAFVQQVAGGAGYLNLFRRALEVVKGTRDIIKARVERENRQEAEKLLFHCDRWSHRIKSMNLRAPGSGRAEWDHIRPHLQNPQQLFKHESAREGIAFSLVHSRLEEGQSYLEQAREGFPAILAAPMRQMCLQGFEARVLGSLYAKRGKGEDEAREAAKKLLSFVKKHPDAFHYFQVISINRDYNLRLSPGGLYPLFFSPLLPELYDPILESWPGKQAA